MDRIVFLFLLGIRPGHTQTTLSFCDGDDLFSINEGDCPGGLNFGVRKPPCVCITGVYRSWTEKCELFDGFLHQFCSTISTEPEDNSEDIGGDGDYTLKGLRLIPGLRNIYQETAAVFGEQDNWAIYLIGMEGLTRAESFYSLNGFPVMLSKGGKGDDRLICIEPRNSQSEVGQQQVCRYFSYENKGVWMTPGETEELIRIKVMTSCDPEMVEGLEGYKVTQLKKHICYDIMDRNVSECELPCEMGQEVGIPGSRFSGVIREKKSPVSKRKESIDKGESRISSEFGGGEWTRTPISSNANFDFHRKLNKYVRLRQVGLLHPPDFSLSPPSRTFSLLETAKHIVQQAIPSHFVSSVFLDTPLELFLLLHKGQDLRYGEDIQPRDFKWIEEILLNCRLGVIQQPLDLRSSPRQPDCGREGLIENICKTSDGDIQACEGIEGGKAHQRGKYHYVIDAVWLIIDMTHVLCQPYFQTSYRMFHVWEQASEKLFTREIRDLWHLPQVDLRVWDSILSNQAMSNIINLDRAVEGAYRLTSLPRLRRLPRQKRNFRRKRNAGASPISVARTLDVFCAKRTDDFDKTC